MAAGACLHRTARPRLLQTGDDDAVAVGDAARHDPDIGVEPVVRDVLQHRLAFRADRDHEEPGIVALDGGGRHAKRLLRAAHDAHVDERAGEQHALGIRDDGAQRHRAGRAVDRGVREVERAGVRVVGAIGQRHVDPGLARIDELNVAARLGAAQTVKVRNRLAEIDVDRINLLDGGRRVLRLANEAPR